MKRRCHKCGWEYPLSTGPGRTESCHDCGSELKVCLNCVSYDPRAAHQCRDRRADPVGDKQAANFCEYFEFVRKEWVPSEGANPREDAARQQLRKLFGD